jgi:hypothetical protein
MLFRFVVHQGPVSGYRGAAIMGTVSCRWTLRDLAAKPSEKAEAQTAP